MPEGERVRLTFTSFDLFPEACGDFVQVYDGFKTGSPSLGKHDVIHVCGMRDECTRKSSPVSPLPDCNATTVSVKKEPHYFHTTLEVTSEVKNQGIRIDCETC